METRSTYTRELERLAENVASMGQDVAGDILATGRAVAEGDFEAASEVVRGHPAVERLNRRVEDACMSLMLLQQPMARDLRLVTAAFRSVSDLARIDEMAYQIALTVEECAVPAPADLAADLGQMATRAATMVEGAIGAFNAEDVEAAERVFTMDDAVDGLYERVRERIVELLRAGGEPASAAPELLTIAKYYERMGDHTQSIADWAIFRSTGAYRGHTMGETR